MLYQDVVSHLDPAEEDTACFEGGCVGYVRNCDNGDHPKQSQYAIREEDRVLVVGIKAKDEAAARSAMEQIGIVHASHTSPGQSTNIPLSAFDKETKYKEPYFQ